MCKKFIDDLPHLYGNVVWMAGCPDDFDPTMVSLCEIQKSLSHLGVKRACLPIQSILFGILSAAPGEARVYGQVEQQRQCRQDAPGGQTVEQDERSHIQASRISLIGQRRIGKTIAENDRAVRDGRFDHLNDMLGSCRKDQGRLAFGGDKFVVRLGCVAGFRPGDIQHQATDLFR